MPRTDLRRWVACDKQGANGQAKYLLMTNHFPQTDGAAGDDDALLLPAATALSHFDLVGRTEEIATFLRAVDHSLGLPAAPAAPHGRQDGGTVRVGGKEANSSVNVTPEGWRYPLDAADLRAIEEANAVDALLYDRYSAARWMCPLLRPAV